ncbi:hypothetical protein RvY_17986 [Ramazzottius varieornatus]|uniref:Phosphatidylinositol-4,5-bisphosphate 4-phosphatase n=1 Tax=Ramazzottius varieornatus TaxID=947166 RepID=A0A1D1WAG5_RAMVA|nr:hypothetical protein RvY_17986 [Ramazzottius varieornatus]
MCIEDSQRIITVAPEADGKEQATRRGSRRIGKGEAISFPTSAINAPLGTYRLTCGHCQQPFLFNILQKSLCKCPYCHRLSALADEHRYIELRKSLAFAVAFLICSVLIILTNLLANRRFAGDIALYITLFIVTGLVAIKPFIVLRMKASSIDGPI